MPPGKVPVASNLAGVEFQTQGRDVTILSVSGTGAGGDTGSAPITVGALTGSRYQ